MERVGRPPLSGGSFLSASFCTRWGVAEAAGTFAWSPAGKIHTSEQHNGECGFRFGSGCVEGSEGMYGGPEGGMCVGNVRVCVRQGSPGVI